MSRFSKFECRLDFIFVATHCLHDAYDKTGRVPHIHQWNVTIGWAHEVSFSDGFTFDVDRVKGELWEHIKPLENIDLNTLFTHPTAEVIAADILDRLPSWFDWVEVGHRLDYRAKISRRNLSQEWLANYRVNGSKVAKDLDAYIDLMHTTVGGPEK